jgi:hypothetical protein
MSSVRRKSVFEFNPLLSDYFVWVASSKGRVMDMPKGFRLSSGETEQPRTMAADR